MSRSFNVKYPYSPLHNSACNPQTQTTQIDAKLKVSKLNVTWTWFRKMNVKKVRAPAQQSFFTTGEVSHLPVIRAEGCGLFRKTSIRIKIFAGWEKFQGNREGKTKIFSVEHGSKTLPPNPWDGKRFEWNINMVDSREKVCVWKMGWHAHEQKPDVVVNYQQTKQTKGCFPLLLLSCCVFK